MIDELTIYPRFPFFPYTTPMNWNRAIRNNRKALAQVVAGLFGFVAWTIGEDRPQSITPHARSHLARVLKTAEAAMRRLIVLFIKVHELEYVERSASGPLPDFDTFNRGKSVSRPRFNLIDPRQPIIPAVSREPVPIAVDWEPEDDWDDTMPHIWNFGDPDPVFDTPEPLPDPKRLLDRLEALDHAIKTLPRQARRMLKEIEKRKSAKPGLGAVPPLRIGEPPGYRKRATHDVDDILRECMNLIRDPVPIPP